MRESERSREKEREGEQEKAVYLHASLIYAHRPATSDKSLTLRHYLFGRVHERARARIFLKLPVKMIPSR